MEQPVNPEEFRNRVKRLLEAFVYDHLKKTGCDDTAKTYFQEVGLDDWPPEWLNLNTNTYVEEVIKTQENSVDNESVERSKSIGNRANIEDEIEENEHEERAEDGIIKEGLEVNERNKDEGITSSIIENKPNDESEMFILGGLDNVIDYTNQNLDTISISSFANISSSGYFPITSSVDESPNIPLPLDVPDGFLNEWWLMFWECFNNLRERDSRINHDSDYFDQ
ncbi:5533_t:CDS:2 [Funneliformis geosporum]|uniref:14419_t:CDS:1 n=1 Tax=Funneliformis geosporum TaxID=1117311 RepID=A0A9W4SFU1_9GLOM|nr:5533_t:CDS:2 [Funneliformis geosporum]CAI2167978.1 14419_t:CDS:2 [Funneliformis geosporum]